MARSGSTKPPTRADRERRLSGTTGGVFRHRCTDLSDAIEAGLPGYSIVASGAEPVIGAVMLAADELGVRPDVDLMARTGPGTEFFYTA